ncbi:MAG: Crp/Fnr family transcriptional regulator [Betaproteobacteria bacterium]|nr:Crp/Fnr family transcriptional regulator [Betaproteobacteria bacterium]
MPNCFSRSAGASGRCCAWRASSCEKVVCIEAVAAARGPRIRPNVGRCLTPRCRCNDNPRDSPVGTFPRRQVPTSALLQSIRPPTADELASIPWLRVLPERERAAASATLVVGHAAAGDLICRIGRAPTYWFGVVEGLLKMSNDSDAGPPITFTGVPPGGWFGEGTLLKREPYRYNIQALRASVVAGLPIDSFEQLLQTSIAFNRFVLNQLNERLGQFIAAREIDRMDDPDTRVARSLAALFHPQLYPGVGSVLRITQQELAYLVGLSRQRVNEALHKLQQQGLIRIEYGGLRVLDLAQLRQRMPEGRQ